MNNNVSILSQRFYILFTLLLFTVLVIAIWTENYLLLVIPAGVIGIIAVLLDYQLVFYALLASIPISLHLKFGNLALDIASEPLMIILLGISPFIFFSKAKEFNFLFHPILTIVYLQLLWSIITAISSVDSTLSLKYILSKLWFVVPFLILGTYFITKPQKVKKLFWFLFIPLLFTIIFTTIKHLREGFSFESSNTVMHPFFHNHVDYSTMVTVFLPFVWFARYWYPKYSFKRMLLSIGTGLFIIGIIASYTRASMLSAALLIPAFFVIKFEKIKWGLSLGSIGVLLTVVFLLNNNKYLDYSIDYKKVVYHGKNFDRLMEATYNMEDISGMERVYRWVAAQNLIRDNFLFGTGPNTFNPEYKKYAVVSFETYVSDNPEQSTTHNYFLLVFSEQGIIGFLLFVTLYFFLLIKGTKLSKKFKDPLINNLAIATTLSLIMLLMHLLLNDMIETDKLGSLFYLSGALLIRLDLWNSEESFYSKEQDI